MSEVKKIICNWKMNGSKELINTICNQLLASKTTIFNNGKSLTLCPPVIYASYLSDVLTQSGLKQVVSSGVQNIFYKDCGAFTGEISPLMLKDFGIDYAIIGHSERRGIFEESNTLISLKLQAALKAGVKPVLCIGEVHEDFINGRIKDVLMTQLDVLQSIDANRLTSDNFIIAYEPVWAIGTGLVASGEQILQAHTFITSYVKALGFAVKPSILYGGSVNEANAGQILSIANVDGLLIGGASLDPVKLISIMQA